MHAIRNSILKFLCIALFLNFAQVTFSNNESSSSTTIVSVSQITCESFLALYDLKWRQIIADVLNGKDIEVAISTNGVEIQSISNLQSTFLDRAISDELFDADIRSLNQVKNTILSFNALEKASKLKFIEAIAERIANTMGSVESLSDLNAVASSAKRFGVPLIEYSRFINYWNNIRHSDPYLTELKFAILIHLLKDPEITANRVAKYRRWTKRLSDFLSKRKASIRGLNLKKISETEYPEELFIEPDVMAQSDLAKSRDKYGQHWDAAYMGHLHNLNSPAAREYHLLMNLRSLKPHLARRVILDFGHTLSQATLMALQSHLEKVEELKAKIDPEIFQLSTEISKLYQSKESIEREIKNILEPNIHFEGLDSNQLAVARLEFASIGTHRNTRIHEDMGSLLDKYKFSLSNAQFATFMFDYIKPKIQAIANSKDRSFNYEILRIHSLTFPLSERQKQDIVELMLNNARNTLEMKHKFIALAEAQWGYDKKSQTQKKLDKEKEIRVIEEAIAEKELKLMNLRRDLRSMMISHGL